MKSFSNYIEVTKKDLPLVCPSNISLWDMHPRVYLPVEKTGFTTCPYCNVNYKFVEAELENKKNN